MKALGVDMTIYVNDQPQPLAASLAELLERLALDTAVVATAVNGQFVPKPARLQTRLENGDRIEIVAPMQGG